MLNNNTEIVFSITGNLLRRVIPRINEQCVLLPAFSCELSHNWRLLIARKSSLFHTPQIPGLLARRPVVETNEMTPMTACCACSFMTLTCHPSVKMSPLQKMESKCTQYRSAIITACYPDKSLTASAIIDCPATQKNDICRATDWHPEKYVFSQRLKNDLLFCKTFTFPHKPLHPRGTTHSHPTLRRFPTARVFDSAQ